MKFVIQQAWQRMNGWDQALFFNLFAGTTDLSFPAVPALTQRLMKAVTRSADGPVYLLVLALIAWQHPGHGLLLLQWMIVAFACEMPLYKIIKTTIKRERPFNQIPGVSNLIQAPDHFSFPSGHTAAAVLMSALLSSLWPLGAVALALLWTWAVLVGISRVYLGVHYPSDVLAGAFLGWASAQIALKGLLFTPILQ